MKRISDDHRVLLHLPLNIFAIRCYGAPRDLMIQLFWCQSDLSCDSNSDRKLVGIPTEDGYRLTERESVSHPGHVADGCLEGLRVTTSQVGVVPVSVGNEIGPVTVVLDKCPKHSDHGLPLGDRTRTQVDVLIVAGPKGRKGFGIGGRHSDPTGLQHRRDHGVDERPQLLAAAFPAAFTHPGREPTGCDDPTLHRVFEIVTDVGDAVGPTDHLPFRGARRRPGPRVVAYAIECLAAEVEPGQGYVGSPRGVIEPADDIRGQGLLARMTPGSVSAIVAQSDGLGQCHVEPACSGNAGGHLGHLQGMGQPCALMIVREDEHLGLPGQTTEGRGMEDPVTVPFEAGPPWIRLLWPLPGAAAMGEGCPRCLLCVLLRFATGAVEARDGAVQVCCRPAVGMSEFGVLVSMGVHGGPPPPIAFVFTFHSASVPHGCATGTPRHAELVSSGGRRNRWQTVERSVPGGRAYRDRAINQGARHRSEEHTSELQSRQYLVCRLL